MLKAQIDAAMRRATSGLNLFKDRVTADVACDDVFAILGDPVMMSEFLTEIVEQPPAELVTERVPHNRIHADQPWREMANGKELDELHIHQRGPGAQRQGIAIAPHIC